MKKALINLMVWSLVCWSGIGLAQAETKTVTAEGASTVSYDAAVREAQRAAVEQGAGTFVVSETEIRNFELQKDKIFTHTEGYLSSFEILDKKQQDGMYVVKIQAEVSLDKVKDELMAMKILLDSLDRPKLMVLIEESYSNMGIENLRLAETQMISLLQRKGFEIVDKAAIEAARQVDQAKQSLAGDETAAKALGLKLGAQYVIIGQALVQKLDLMLADPAFKTMNASLEVRILHSQSGKILGSVVEKGRMAHISELEGASQALQKAADKAVNQYLTETILASFQDFLNNGIPLKVTVSGVKTFEQSTAIVSFIESLDKVAACRREGWNKAGGILMLDLRYKGSSEELAAASDRKPAAGGKLSVEDLAPERLDLLLQ